jgi:hypothetical protein
MSDISITQFQAKKIEEFYYWRYIGTLSCRVLDSFRDKLEGKPAGSYVELNNNLEKSMKIENVYFFVDTDGIVKMSVIPK